MNNPLVFSCKKDSEKYSNIAAGKTLKTVLDILPDNVDAGKCTLVCEISSEGFMYAIKDDEANAYIGASLSHFDRSTGNDDYSVNLKNVLQRQSVLSQNFKKVYIIHSLEESVLIPFYLYDSEQNANAVNLIYGDLQSNASILTDVIWKNEVYNAYRIATPVLEMINAKFPDAINRHQYSILLQNVPVNKDKMFIIFYSKKIVVILSKNGKTQFINTFSYKSAGEVVYILLNICKQFEVENIPLEIGGMIESNSALCAEIHKYFNTLTFTELPSGCNYSEEITKHPAHYFSHIFGVDSCE